MIRHTTPRRTFTLISAGLVLGCGEGPASVARDSAGIRIVENERAAWTDQQRWRIAAEPRVDIGGGDSASAGLLYRVVTAHRLRDGRIAVANTGTSEVRIFDSTGRHLTTIGRRGQGPGEFQSPWHIIERSGDSLLILDLRGLRFNIFGPDGTFARSFTTPVATGGGPAELAGSFSDASLLMRRHEVTDRAPQPSGLAWSYISLFRVGADGARLDSLGRFRQQAIMGGSGLYIWGPQAHEAVHDSTVYYGAGDSFEIQAYSMRGDLKAIIRRSLPPPPTTPAHIEAFKEEALRREAQAGASPRRRATSERMLAEARYAPTFPSFFQLETDDTGNLWVQEYSPKVGEGRVWSVFDPSGVYLGEVEMPERFRVFQIGDDFVLGQWRDADDVEHVRMYPIVKPR